MFGIAGQECVTARKAALRYVIANICHNTINVTAVWRVVVVYARDDGIASLGGDYNLRPVCHLFAVKQSFDIVL